MTQTQHTQGTWEVGTRGDNMLAVYSKADKTKPICVFHGEGGEFPEYFDKKKLKLNAALIAAAPDLLEALKKIIADHDVYRAAFNNNAEIVGNEGFTEARAAIAKAEGR